MSTVKRHADRRVKNSRSDRNASLISLAVCIAIGTLGWYLVSPLLS